MDMKQDGQVIYLKDLLFSALYQWKTILIWGVLLAMLLGGYKGVTSFASMKNEQAQMENYAQQELERELYEARKANLQQQIEANRVNARHQQKYLDESMLMKLDAYQHYEVYLSCFLDTGYQIVPGMSFQNPDPINAIVRAYTDGVVNETNAKLLAEAIATNPEYLRELLVVEAAYEAQGFSIIFKVPDQATGEKLLESLKQVVELLHGDASGSVAPHEVRISEGFIRRAIDHELAKLQQEQADRLAELNDVITDLQQQKNNLQLTKALVVSGDSVIKDTVVFAVVGGILGAMLVVLCAWMKHIFSTAVYSGRTLSNRTGIKVFGCVKAEKRRNSVDTWLRTREGRNNLPTDKQSAMLACSIAAAMGNKGVLQISGDCAEKERIAFAEALRRINSNITVCDAGNLLQDVSARQALSQADVVLLMEQCGVSTYGNVQQQMDVVAEHGKKLLGCVLLDG